MGTLLPYKPYNIGKPRVTRYVGTQFWNQGRTQEIKDRVLHVDLDEPAVTT